MLVPRGSDEGMAQTGGSPRRLFFEDPMAGCRVQGAGCRVQGAGQGTYGWKPFRASSLRMLSHLAIHPFVLGVARRLVVWSRAQLMSASCSGGVGS